MQAGGNGDRIAPRHDLPPSQHWARLRFAVVGGLLANAPASGSVRATIAILSERQWMHPITGMPVHFSIPTIERWYYTARRHQHPTLVLMRTVRRDAGRPRSIDAALAQELDASYREHVSWSYLLHYDNIMAALPPERRSQAPSYSAVQRFMRQHGLVPRHLPADRHRTAGAMATRARFEHREVRLFEHTHTHALWHIDAHHGGMGLSHRGQMQRPALIALIDDHSRMILHAQWFWREDTAAAAHVLKQAIAKRGLPRMLLSDNGGPFVAAEIRDGLHRLGVLLETTMCYAPNQNGKMEVFWGQVEGRLVAMLVGNRELDLYRLNELTHAWVEQDYHRRHHAGIGTTPLQRYETAPHVGRTAPVASELAQAFTRREKRQQRLSDGSISLAGRRFEIPSRYRHLTTVVVRYASWDLNQVFLAHPESDAILERLFPVDPHANAAGARRLLQPIAGTASHPASPSASMPPAALPPLLQGALSAARASGLPPAFIPFSHEPIPPSPEPRHDAHR